MQKILCVILLMVYGGQGSGDEISRNYFLYDGGQNVHLAMLNEFKYAEQLSIEGDCQVNTTKAQTESKYILSQSGFKVADQDNKFASTLLIHAMAKEQANGSCLATMAVIVAYHVLTIVPFAENTEFRNLTFSLGQLEVTRGLTYAKADKLQNELELIVEQATKELVVFIGQRRLELKQKFPVIYESFSKQVLKTSGEG